VLQKSGKAFVFKAESVGGMYLTALLYNVWRGAEDWTCWSLRETRRRVPLHDHLYHQL